MMSTGEIKQQIFQTKLNNLQKDLQKLIEKEIDAIAQQNLQLIQDACIEKTGYNKDNLRELFINTAKSEPKDVNKLLQTAWNNKDLSLDKKAEYLADYTAKTFKKPSSDFVKYVTIFIDILKTDVELNLFLKNPQEYINNKKNLSAYQLHILQLVINDPVFNNFPSITRAVTNTFISTPVTTEMYKLNLPEYASTDATRFPQCINPDVEDTVLEKSKKQYHGPQVMGLGAQPSYDRGSIARTAKSVRQMKMGACHNFAQLAADHFLSLMENGKMKEIPIKMVSHKAALGSHTFLLFDHKIEDLTNLSNCLIVDPWAVAMGHNYTYGVFTQENYPFPDMTTNLECCFDTQNLMASNKTSVAKSGGQTVNQELTRVLAREGLFANRQPSTTQEPVLSRTQSIAVTFLTHLAKYAEEELNNSTRKEFINTLINEVKNNDMGPGHAIRTATLVTAAKVFEKTDENSYSWKGTRPFKKSILPAFNEPEALKFWSRHLLNKELITTGVTSIDANLLYKIVTSLDSSEEHTYSKSQTLNITNK